MPADQPPAAPGGSARTGPTTGARGAPGDAAPGPGSADDRFADDRFADVAGRQRAHRSFTDEPVDDATVGRLLAAAVCAPSAENRQPWEFVVVRDDGLRAEIGALTARVWAAGARRFSESRLSPELLAAVDAGARGGVSAAPVLVVVCADLDRGLEATIGSSIFPAVQNLLLAATAEGLGSALTTLTTMDGGELAALLGLPDHVRAVAVVPVGHPARLLGPPRRDPFARHTHRDRYGIPWEGGGSGSGP